MSKGAIKADQVVYGVINTLHKFTQGSAYEAIVYFSAFLAENCWGLSYTNLWYQQKYPLNFNELIQCINKYFLLA